jgi:MOSC domain-containing protein YiiM
MIPAADSPLARLLDGPMRPGRVLWIGLRPARREGLVPVERAELVVGEGLVGDHYAGRSHERDVTLMQREDLDAIASFLDRDAIDPALLRRNILVEGINLLALKDRRIRIGTAELEWTGECDPCGRMDENLGSGGYNAVRRHGGITARVVTSGVVRIGDTVERLLPTRS